MFGLDNCLYTNFDLLRVDARIRTQSMIFHSYWQVYLIKYINPIDLVDKYIKKKDLPNFILYKMRIVLRDRIKLEQ